MDLSNASWRKSSYSGGAGQDGDCVEVAIVRPAIAVRDSKAPTGSLIFTEAAWRGLVSAVQAAHES